MRVCCWIVLLCGIAAAGCRSDDVPEARRERPNLLLIVADDMGYSDLGSYGSEIRTPHLDELARSGMRATDFYVAPRGSATRAMLLTGIDLHLAGFGRSRIPLSPGIEPPPGYEGRLNPRALTLARRLRDAGYHTYMAGKWELGEGARSDPNARGFEHSFALHDGAASHWSDMRSAVPGRDRAHYTRDGEPVEELPDDYFSSRFFTDTLISDILENHADDEPFFAYLSFQAPHGPLALPKAWRESRGRYDKGFDEIREARLLRMKQLGLVAHEVRPYPGLPTVPRWNDLPGDVQQEQARKMELYAAMVEDLDANVGRLIDFLKEIDEYRDTVVVFLSDNGAEAGDRGPSGMDGRNREWYLEQFDDCEIESWGQPGCFVEYGPGWAQVSTVPFRLFKGTLGEGGVRVPLIISGPVVSRAMLDVARRRGRVSRAQMHVTDIAPTLLELARAPLVHPEHRNALPIQGKSLVPVLEGDFWARNGPHEWVAFELAENRGIRKGYWKLVSMPPPFGLGRWRLYRLDRDPSELYDLSQKRREEVEELSELWRSYAREHGVVIPESASR